MVDEIDKKIMTELQFDSKQTIKELSEKMNLTPTPVYERIKKLEENGFIVGYKAQINRFSIGLSLMVFCNISLKEHQAKFLSQFEKDIQPLDEVMACYHLGGMYDYLLKICVRNMDEYQKFIANKLANIKNIANVQSSFVMKEIKESNNYNFND
jgi:Lrp/AsnC family transcriptional regulator, leucine-responsive regulatory protein